MAITKSGSTVTFYIDGVAAGTATISGASIPSGAKKIGYDNYSGSGSYFSGLMDEVRIYNRVLTVQEIATLAVLPPKLNIINPQAGSMVTGTTVVASYNASGDLTTVAKVVLQLDTNPQITLANLSGTSQFNNLAEGQHTLQGYLMKSDSSKITGSDISISFGTQLSDTTPPATPKGLNATSADKQVILTWTNNSETDLAGYNVYRCASAAGTYTKLNASLLTNATYTDTGLTNGTTYYYEITALDTAGNESAKAAAVNTVPAVNTGNVYYVSTSGSDTANGSATAPWQTLQYAAGKVGADDTVMVLPGTYAGMNLVGSSYGGASEHPVTFIANTGDYRTSGVLINTFASSDSTHNAAINIESTKGYFIIKGFTVTASGTQKAGIRVAANPGCQILNNEVYKTFTGIFASIADGVVVQGNKSHDNDGQHGIYVNGTNGYAIRNNECYNNVNDGIHTNVCDGGNLINTNGTIEGNLVYGNAISGFDITGCSNCTFQNNISYGNVTHGIVLQNTNQNPTPNCHDNLLVNNIFIGNLSNTSAYGIHTGTVDNYTNAILFNNIAIGATANNGIESAILSAPGVKLSNNITTNSSSLFVSSTDYHSKSTSPAIDAGVASFNSKSAPVTDKDGVVRPQGGTFDIGAYEYK